MWKAEFVKIHNSIFLFSGLPAWVLIISFNSSSTTFELNGFCAFGHLFHCMFSLTMEIWSNHTYLNREAPMRRWALIPWIKTKHQNPQAFLNGEYFQNAMFCLFSQRPLLQPPQPWVIILSLTNVKLSTVCLLILKQMKETIHIA